MPLICHDRDVSATENYYQSFTQELMEIDGETYQVRVHWARRNGRMAVVGFDMRAFFSEPEAPALKAILRGDGGLHFTGGEVTTSTLRAVRLAELTERSRRILLESLHATPVAVGEEAERAAIAEGVEGTRQRPGPKPVVSEEVLERVVAPAYRNGGRRPVEAVREALVDANLPGLNRHVTREQASKAVERARRLGIIPPAPRRTR